MRLPSTDLGSDDQSIAVEPRIQGDDDVKRDLEGIGYHFAGMAFLDGPGMSARRQRRRPSHNASSDTELSSNDEEITVDPRIDGQERVERELEGAGYAKACIATLDCIVRSAGFYALEGLLPCW
jgi:hypothetical protein